jgi:hypothetical protein
VKPVRGFEQRDSAKSFRRRANFFPVFICLENVLLFSALPEQRLRPNSRLNLKTSIPSIRGFWDAWDGWDGEF